MVLNKLRATLTSSVEFMYAINFEILVILAIFMIPNVFMFSLIN